jgi:hypothetical protein
METQKQLGYQNNLGQFEQFSTAQILDFIEQKQNGRLFVRDLEVQLACEELRKRAPSRRFTAEEFRVALEQSNIRPKT